MRDKHRQELPRNCRNKTILRLEYVSVKLLPCGANFCSDRHIILSVEDRQGQNTVYLTKQY